MIFNVTVTNFFSVAVAFLFWNKMICRLCACIVINKIFLDLKELCFAGSHKGTECLVASVFETDLRRLPSHPLSLWVVLGLLLVISCSRAARPVWDNAQPSSNQPQPASHPPSRAVKQVSRRESFLTFEKGPSRKNLRIYLD